MINEINKEEEETVSETVSHEKNQILSDLCCFCEILVISIALALAILHFHKCLKQDLHLFSHCDYNLSSIVLLAVALLSGYRFNTFFSPDM